MTERKQAKGFLSKDKVKAFLVEYWPFLLLFAVAAFLRFYKISYAFSVNGIDEGVHLMAGKLGANGYEMYTQINTLQGPLFLFIYGLFNGNVVAARSLSALFSLFGIAGVCYLASKVSNRTVAAMTGVFLAFNYYFIKEARLASMDLFASALLIGGFFFLWPYISRTKPFADRKDYMKVMGFMAISAAFFSAAAMTKLFSVIPLIFLSGYLTVIWILDWKKHGFQEGKAKFFILAVFALSIIATTLLIMSIYGFEITLNGIFLNNLHRPDQPYFEKMLIFLLFVGLLLIPFIFSFLPVVKFRKRREIHILGIWLYPLLIMYLFQALTWTHHYTIIAPPLCILGGWGIYEFFHMAKDRVPEFIGSRKTTDVLKKRHPYVLNKATRPFVPPIIFFDTRRRVVYSVVVLFVLAMIISNFVMVLPVEKPVAYSVAEDLMDLTEEQDFIISGDPLITNYAGRLQVPEVANLAMVKYPPVTPGQLINYTEWYQVKAVVFTYNLSNQEDYIDYIQDNYLFIKAYDEDGLESFVENEIEITMQTYTIYIRPADP